MLGVTEPGNSSIITTIVAKSGIILSFVKVARYAIIVICKARKKNDCFTLTKTKRKPIDLLIYSFYFDAISYRDSRVTKHYFLSIFLNLF